MICPYCLTEMGQRLGCPACGQQRDEEPFDGYENRWHADQLSPAGWFTQCAAAAEQIRDDEARMVAEGLTLELAQPLRPEQLGTKPATDQQPGLFGPQQSRMTA